MDLTIRQYSNPPIIMKIVGNESNIDSINQILEKSTIAFTMFDEKTNQKIIANREATLEHYRETLDNLDRYRLKYQLSASDTSKTGKFRGEFIISYFDDHGELISDVFPKAEKFYINILGSISNRPEIEIC